MRLISDLFRAARRRLREQDGVVMLYALAATLVVLASSAAAFAAIDTDQPLSTADASEKQAYSAAQAGIQRYIYELNENSEYWTECTAGADWIFNTGTTPTPQYVPGSTTEKYEVTLLPAAGQSTYKSCDLGDPVDSMVQESGNGAGTIRISSTGYAGGLTRTIVAALREQSFLDYAWFTNFETVDPVQQVAEAAVNDPTLEYPPVCAAAGKSAPGGCGTNYSAALTGATSQCANWRYGRHDRETADDAGYGPGVFFKDGSGAYRCEQIQFVTGDSINGPFHSNDSVLVCGTPSFGTAAGDSVQFGGPSPGWVGAGCGGDDPTIDGSPTGKASQSQDIEIPPTNTLSSVAQKGWTFPGTTCLTLNASNITVSQPVTNTKYPSCFSPGIPTKTVAYPTNGVIYVNSGASGCSLQYDVEDPSYTGYTGCGNVYVSGQDAKPLTIGAAGDIIIDGNLTYGNSTAMLGLIAQDFVRVYHPVGSQPTGTNQQACSQGGYANAPGSLTNLTIDAMILSLDDSFIVDQYDCGSRLGTLTVNGGIAQNYRGTVGTGAGANSATGYLKNYNYDPRLRYEEPPHFLTPVEGAWDIERETECEQAASCDSTTLS